MREVLEELMYERAISQPLTTASSIGGGKRGLYESYLEWFPNGPHAAEIRAGVDEGHTLPERAIHDSLVGVNLDVNSEPIERGGGITLSSNPFRDGFSNGRATPSVDEGSLTPPAENHVYVIGHLTIKAGIDFELNHGDDWYLQAADGEKYSPHTKMLMIGWVAGGKDVFYAGSEPRRVEVFFEVPEAAANGARVVFFGKQFELTSPESGGQEADTQAAGTGQVFRPGPNIENPRVLHSVSAKYTAEAIQAKVTGVVVLELVVLPDGTVGDITVMKSLDSRFGLDQAAVKAVKQTRFAPGTRLGEPVAVRVTMEISFSLR